MWDSWDVLRARVRCVALHCMTALLVARTWTCMYGMPNGIDLISCSETVQFTLRGVHRREREGYMCVFVGGVWIEWGVVTHSWPRDLRLVHVMYALPMLSPSFIWLTGHGDRTWWYWLIFDRLYPLARPVASMESTVKNQSTCVVGIFAR
jgi:hypothetical protein